jgi:DNA-binding beta-propeller fold protein YncE
MKKNLLPKLSFAGCLLLSTLAHSQDVERYDHAHSNNRNSDTYAVTDSMRNGMKWTSLRTLDLRTGDYSRILVPLLNSNELMPPAGTPSSIPYNAVAAIAYDKDNKRVYYTPMLTDKLYYIDTRSWKRYLVSNQFTGLMPKTADQSNIITRMVIGDDDKGYALTNDGRHFIRFRTDRNFSITDLGSLVDAPGNGEMSVHNLCSSFGGDLIADDDDHLYLFTSRNHVFKIDIRSKLTKYIGTVSNLPAGFTTSGVVTDKAGEKVFLVSAADSTGIYTVNLKTLIAKRLNTDHPRLPADLANGYTLEDHDRPHHDHHRVMFDDNEDENTANVRLYPNPVTGGEFKIDFANANPGAYTIRVTDANGKTLLTKSVSIGGKGSTATINLPPVTSSGIYLVRVTDVDNKAWYSGKIIVQ